MPLAPDLAAVLVHHSLLPAIPTSGDAIADGRAAHERDAAYFTPHRRRRPVAVVEEAIVADGNVRVPVRIYRSAESAAGRVPTVLWVHGGGWVTGSLHTADALARRVAADCDAVVVSVDYRLAPEHPWPAGLDDVTAAFAWLVDNVAALGGDLSRIGVGGDSSGGNLAAVLAQQARDAGWPLAAQLLVYPVTDCDLDADHRSRLTQADGPYVTWQSVADCVEHYLPVGVDPREPLASPLHHPDLHGLAPAVVATVELDPLRDEGDAYAAALAEAGVRVVHLSTPGLPHGAFDMAGVSATADRAVREAMGAFRGLLASGSEGESADDPDAPANIPARFLHVHKAVMLARAPLAPPARRQLTAGVVGVDPYRYRATELELMRAVQRAAALLLADPVFRSDLDAVAWADDERIVALGDSITDDSCSWAEQLRAVLAVVRPGITVVNHGVTGATTQDQLARVDLLCQARPTQVIQFLGTNDARRQGNRSQVRMLELGETITNLGKIASVVSEEAQAQLVRMTPTPVVDTLADAWEPFLTEQISWRSDDIAEIAAVVRAADQGAIDLHAAFEPDPTRWLLPDGVHPTIEGQTVILRTLVRGLAGRR